MIKRPAPVTREFDPRRCRATMVFAKRVPLGVCDSCGYRGDCTMHTTRLGADEFELFLFCFACSETFKFSCTWRELRLLIKRYGPLKRRPQKPWWMEVRERREASEKGA